MEQILYCENNLLMQRSSTAQEPELEVDVFLVSDFCIHEWGENYSQYGNDISQIYPAFIEGKKGFLIRRYWQAAPGYCAVGTEEELLNFKDGVELLLKLGAYEHIFEKD